MSRSIDDGLAGLSDMPRSERAPVLAIIAVAEQLRAQNLMSFSAMSNTLIPPVRAEVLRLIGPVDGIEEE